MMFDENAINEIFSKHKISCIVTPSSPSFAYPATNVFKKSPWVAKDKSLLNDLNDERVMMDRIYNKIIESKSKPYMWAYSRFDTSNQSMINDMLFQSLCPFQFLNFNDTAAEFFNIDFSKQLKENEFSSNGEMVKKSYTISSSIGDFRNAFNDDDIFGVADEEIDEDDHAEEGNEQEEMGDFEMANPNMEMAQVEAENVNEMNGVPYLGDTIHWEPGRYAILEDNIAAPTLDMDVATAERAVPYEIFRESVDVALRQ